MNFNRRNFITKAGIAALSFSVLSAFKNKERKPKMKSIFYHHVFFWLQNTSSPME